MNYSVISLFDNITQTKNGHEIAIDLFLDGIQNGSWQDDVLAYRNGKREKKSLPYVTISGKFNERSISGLQSHSGYLGIDIDDVDDIEYTKSIVCPDPHVYACFVSCGGRGLCLIFKINPDKHAESFEGLQEYLFRNYKIVSDPSCRDVSRARFVSYDPYSYVNPGAAKFTQYLKRQPGNKVVEQIFVQTDFDEIIDRIVSTRIDITGDYRTWLKLGFALADKFGEGGRNYFHLISQFHGDYTPQICDRQFTNCLKSRKSGITISSFYYCVKQAGIPLESARTKMVSQAAHFAKKGGRTKDSVIQYLEEVEGMAPEVTREIVDQVFDSNIKIDTSDSEIDAVETWLRQNYTIRRNLVTRYIEINGKQMTTVECNTIWKAAKRVFDKLPFEHLDRIINSDFPTDYHPLLDFFDRYSHVTPSGLIEKLFATLDSDTGLGDGQFYPEYKWHFGKKWLVSLIAAAHGEHSPLMLVLSGRVQGTGKTEFFRRLLPSELRHYFADSKLDREKDDEILMTQKWLICDDEMGGKSKGDARRFKELMSKQVFSLREPYGRNNVDLQRLAVLCGTTNDEEVLNDPTGNRRIIPIEINSIDQELYNSINKIELFMEAYHLYKSGYDWRLSRHDIEVLGANTANFQAYSAEYEIIASLFEKPAQNAAQYDYRELSATEIKSIIESKTPLRLSLKALGSELKRMGFVSKLKRVEGNVSRVYKVVEKGRGLTPGGPL